MGLEAVVFDMDGVLVDSEPVWEEVRRAVVAEHGGRWAPDAQRRLMGMSTGEWAAYLSRDLGVGLPPDEVAALVIGRMADRYREHLPLLPGAVEAVRAAAEGWPVGIASSSPPRLIDAVLDFAGLRQYVRVAMSTEAVRHGKPAPDIYLSVTDRLGVAPRRALAFEDSSNGLRSAAAAGLIVIAVPRPEYPPDDSALALSAHVIDGLDGLTKERVADLSSGA